MTVWKIRESLLELFCVVLCITTTIVWLIDTTYWFRFKFVVFVCVVSL